MEIANDKSSPSPEGRADHDGTAEGEQALRDPRAILKRPWSSLPLLGAETRQPLKATVAGYKAVSPAERAGFWMLSALGVTIGVARAISYGLERDRNAPRLRSLGRRVYQAVDVEGLRVHHFLPGIGLTFAAGAAGVLRSADRHEFALSVPFGTGAGLILDEIGLLVKSDNPYWQAEPLALVEGVAAALGAATLALRFHRRGAAGLDERSSTAEEAGAMSESAAAA